MDMDKKDMLERVAKAARRAYMKGFAAGSGGNVSIRFQRQVYISPSGIWPGGLDGGGYDYAGGGWFSAVHR